MRKNRWMRGAAVTALTLALGTAVILTGCGNSKEQETTAEAVTVAGAVAETTEKQSQQVAQGNDTQESADKDSVAAEETVQGGNATKETAQEEGATKKAKEPQTAKTSKNTKSKKKSKKKIPLMKDIYEEVAKAAGLTDMYSVDGMDLADTYNISLYGCLDYAIYQSNTIEQADLVGLFRCGSKSSADMIESGLNVLLEAMQGYYKDQMPDVYAKLSKTKVERKGKIVYLIICENLDAARKVVEKYF